MNPLKVLLPIDLQNRSEACEEIKKTMIYFADKVIQMHFLSILPGKPVPLLGGSKLSEELISALAVLEEELVVLINEAIPELTDYTTKAVEGSVHKEILKYADELQPDLIILPSHSHSKVENILIGSVTSKVVEKANCSVLVVR